MGPQGGEHPMDLHEDPLPSEERLEGDAGPRGSPLEGLCGTGTGPCELHVDRIGRPAGELREHDRLASLDDGLRIRVREDRLGGHREVGLDADEHRDPDGAEQRTDLGRGVVAVERE